jgi:hypothetical protein
MSAMGLGYSKAEPDRPSEVGQCPGIFIWPHRRDSGALRRFSGLIVATVSKTRSRRFGRFSLAGASL